MHPKKIFFRCLMYPFIAVSVLSAAGTVHAQSSWQMRTPFPAPPAEFLAVAASGKLYLFGGLAPKFVPRGLVYEYNPATDGWTAKKPMPLPSHHLALAEYNGKIYSFGGFKLPASGEIAWEPIDNSWEYDPATDMWGVPRARMSTPRASMVWAVHGGRIYIVGGEIQSSQVSSTFRTVEACEPATNQWLVLPPAPLGRQPIAGDVIGDTLYVVSGDNGDRPLIGVRGPSEPFPFDALRLSSSK